MEIPITLDLSSVAGVVAATMLIVHWLKVSVSAVPYLNAVPIPIYTLAVSAGLTWVAHDGLGLLQGGSFKELAVQAALASLTASGFWEQARSMNKPIKDSTAARKSTGLIVVLCAVALTASCASAGKNLYRAEDAIHDSISVMRNVGQKICRPGISAETAESCRKFYADFADVIRDASLLNEALASDSFANTPAIVASLDSMAKSIQALVPDPAQAADIRRRVDEALAKLRQAIGR